MFSKGSKQASANSNGDGARSAPKSSVPSIISADLRINGDLICSGDVQVDGWVEGDIQSRNIVIGEGATVHGALQAESVRICGVVKGSIKADSVVLEKTAKVTGDVLHKTLSVEAGRPDRGHVQAPRGVGGGPGRIARAQPVGAAGQRRHQAARGPARGDQLVALSASISHSLLADHRRLVDVRVAHS